MKTPYKIFILIFFILSFSVIKAQDVRVSLFYDQLTEALTFHCVAGEYKIELDDRELLTITEGDIVFLEQVGNTIRLSDNSGVIGEYPSLGFKDIFFKGRYMLKTVKPVSDQRLYKGDLFISVEHDALELINELEFSHYLAGVVEAEAGPGAPEQFFKAQAVLCRTYAIKNWHRHSNEGFNLCDDTHCQVFHGIADDNPSIINAVLSTHNIVVADKNYNLISAAYHSNSGGETQKASNIWPGEHEYLLPVIDPYSVDQPGFKWSETIPREIWISYLNARGVELESTENDKILIRQAHRKVNFIVNEDTLKIKNIREDLGLRSSFFNMRLEGDNIIFEGRGYGHGIGLSQEGAIEMARKGFSYMDILNFYYYEVQIRDLDEMPESAFPSVFR